MSQMLTVPSSIISVQADGPITPAMTALIWRIASTLDAQRVNPVDGDPLWLRLETSVLRGTGARDDNVWLKELLRRLRKIELEGVEKDREWAAQLIAQVVWEDGGRVVRLLLPPAAVAALSAPRTFAKIEEKALIELPPHGRQLYALLADKKRLKRPSWRFELSELKAAMGVAEKTSYERFNAFRQRVLDPAVSAINDLGTVFVTATPDKVGRSVAGITFKWAWKTLGEASETIIENERHSTARRKHQTEVSAPPMIDTSQSASSWWNNLKDNERNFWKTQVETTMVLELPGGRSETIPRRETDIAIDAYAARLSK